MFADCWTDPTRIDSWSCFLTKLYYATRYLYLWSQIWEKSLSTKIFILNSQYLKEPHKGSTLQNWNRLVPRTSWSCQNLKIKGPTRFKPCKLNQRSLVLDMLHDHICSDFKYQIEQGWGGSGQKRRTRLRRQCSAVLAQEVCSKLFDILKPKFLDRFPTLQFW